VIPHDDALLVLTYQSIVPKLFRIHSAIYNIIYTISKFLSVAEDTLNSTKIVNYFLSEVYRNLPNNIIIIGTLSIFQYQILELLSLNEMMKYVT